MLPETGGIQVIGNVGDPKEGLFAFKPNVEIPPPVAAIGWHLAQQGLDLPEWYEEATVSTANKHDPRVILILFMQPGILRLCQRKPIISFMVVVVLSAESNHCLLYTSDAADDLLCVDLGGRRLIKKKKN